MRSCIKNHTIVIIYWLLTAFDRQTNEAWGCPFWGTLTWSWFEFWSLCWHSIVQFCIRVPGFWSQNGMVLPWLKMINSTINSPKRMIEDCETYSKHGIFIWVFVLNTLKHWSQSFFNHSTSMTPRPCHSQMSFRSWPWTWQNSDSLVVLERNPELGTLSKIGAEGPRDLMATWWRWSDSQWFDNHNLCQTLGATAELWTMMMMSFWCLWTGRVLVEMINRHINQPHNWKLMQHVLLGVSWRKGIRWWKQVDGNGKLLEDATAPAAPGVSVSCSAPACILPLFWEKVVEIIAVLVCWGVEMMVAGWWNLWHG